MIIGNEPIVPTIYRQTGDNESRIATPKDIQEGIHLFFEPGLTIRQYYAGLAMQAILSNSIIYVAGSPEGMAKEALRCADALINELNKESFK